MIDPRIREILGSYGGDAARWPADERAGVEAALGADARLRAERASEQELDAMLTAWATRPVGRSDAGAAAARVLDPARPSRPWWQVAAGGGLAAGLGVLVMLAGPGTTAVSPPTVQTASAVTDEGAFASVFTTTPDEESVL